MDVLSIPEFLHIEHEYCVGDAVFCVIIDNGFFHSKNMTYNPHMHARYEMHVGISGKYSLELSETGEIIEIAKNTVVIIPPGCYHSTIPENDGEQSPEDGCLPEKLTVYFNIEKSKKIIPENSKDIFSLLEAGLSEKVSEPLIFKNEQMAALLNCIKKELVSGGICFSEMAGAYMQQFLVCFIRSLTAGINKNGKTGDDKENIPSSNVRDTKNARELYIIQLIDRYYGNPEFDEKMLSKAMNLSQRQICRLFSEYFGMSFRKKLNEVRIRQACRYLAHTDYTADEIARRIGYISASAFYVSFRKSCGITPIEYRKKVEKNSEEFSKQP